jgi:hypothetical protein
MTVQGLYNNHSLNNLDGYFFIYPLDPHESLLYYKFASFCQILHQINREFPWLKK